jgi:hypothetical protein
MGKLVIRNVLLSGYPCLFLCIATYLVVIGSWQSVQLPMGCSLFANDVCGMFAFSVVLQVVVLLEQFKLL